MHRKSLFIGLFLVSAVCLAQAPIPGAAKQQIADHTMLIEDRGSKVEVIASKRVVADKGRNGGKPGRAVVTTIRSEKIDDQHLGVGSITRSMHRATSPGTLRSR